MGNESDIAFSHVLQKTGILKNFSIAKTVPLTEIENIKKEVKAKTSSEEEYKKLFQKKIQEYSNMHDPKNPIPGIIYLQEDEKKRVAYVKYAKEWAKKIKTDSATKKDLAFLIKAMIVELGLSQEDFDDDDAEETPEF